MTTLLARLTSHFELHTGRRRVLGLVSLGLAVLAALVALAAFANPTTTAPAGWIPYLSAPVFFIAGVYLLFPYHPTKTRPTPLTPVVLICLLAILVLAGFMRFYQFDTLPFGTWWDEASIGQVAKQIINNPGFRPYFVEDHDHPLHFFALVAMSFQLFGPTTEAIRLITVLFGLGTVGIAFLAGREMYSSRFGLLLAFFLAISRWHVTFSRFGLYTISVGFFEILTIWLLLRARRTGQLHDFAWAGLALGLAANFYISMRLFIFVVLIFLIYWLVIAFWPKAKNNVETTEGSEESASDTPVSPSPVPSVPSSSPVPSVPPNPSTISKPALLGGLVAFALGALFFAAPLIQFAVIRPEVYWFRVGDASILTFRDDPALSSAITSNTLKHLLMFNYEGDRNGRHNISGEPMLDPVMGVLFVLGAALAISRFRHPVHLLMILIFAVNLLGGIFSVDFEAPQANRVFGAIVAVMYFAALAVETLWRGFAKVSLAAAPRQAVLALALLGVGGYIVYDNANTYFVRQANTERVWEEYNGIETLAAEKMIEVNPDQTTIYASVFLENHLVIQFLAPQVKNTHAIIPPQGLPIRETGDKPVAIFVDPGNEWIVEQAKRYYPHAAYEQYYKPGGNVALWRIMIPVEQIKQLQGVTARYWAGETPQGEPAITRTEQSLSAAWAAGATPLALPFAAQWDTTLYAPQYGDYELILKSPGAATLWLDEQQLQLTADSGGQHIILSLAQGDHALRLQAAGGESAVSLEWRSPAGEIGPIPANSLYLPDRVAVRGLLGTYSNGESATQPPAFIRIDPFIDIYFHLIPLGRPYNVTWTGRINLPESGEWAFGLTINGSAKVFIDDQVVLEAPEPAKDLQSAPINLDAGWHKIRIEYLDTYQGSNIHLTWTPPGKEPKIIPGDSLSPYH